MSVHGRFKVRMLCLNSAALKHVGIDLISARPKGRHFTHRSHRPESNRCCSLSKYLGLKSKSPSLLLYQWKHHAKLQEKKKIVLLPLSYILKFIFEISLWGGGGPIKQKERMIRCNLHQGENWQLNGKCIF